MLDKAQQLNMSAREVFEFTARCCSTTSRCRSGDGGGGESSSSVRCSSSPSSAVGGGTTAGAGAAASAGDDKKMDNDVTGFSLSVEELNEGAALLVKVRRSTSAPANPDDRSAKPKSRMAVHLGVRHRVEVGNRRTCFCMCLMGGYVPRRDAAVACPRSSTCSCTFYGGNGFDGDRRIHKQNMQQCVCSYAAVCSYQRERCLIQRRLVAHLAPFFISRPQTCTAYYSHRFTSALSPS